tara:strand:+ start:2114 stop:4042 length:1929 start_codon:yes stop_codon:yes gene_type:complete
MDEFVVCHAIDSLCVGGAQTMLFELYEAINKYHPHIKQNIILLNKDFVDEEYMASHGIKDYHPLSPPLFVQTMLDYKMPAVAVYHKLMTSDTKFYRKLHGRVPLVVVNHTYSDAQSYNRIEPCDVIVCVSEGMKAHLRRLYRKEPMRVIRNAVNGSRYTGIQPIERSYDNRLVTGRINALNRIKYSDEWLKWMYRVELPFILEHDYIGGGGFLSKAKGVVKGNRKKYQNQVNIMGSVNDFDKKISILKSWDLFVYEINRNEGISMAILESLASGVPVICSNHHGNREIIKNGINGYVFKSKGELKETLKDLGRSRRRIDDLKRSTINHFNKYLDAKVMASNYVSLFEDVLSGKVAEGPIKGRIKPVKRKRIMVKKDLPDPSKSDTIKYDKPLFSILTASFNKGKYLEDWANSVIAQSYRPLEVVFVDDASTDDTQKLVKGLFEKIMDAGVSVKHIRNDKRTHCASSYDVAWQNATGEIFGVLDSDDMLTEDACEFIVDLYKKHEDITYIYTQFDIYTKKWEFRRKGYSLPPIPGESLLDMGKRRKHTFSHWRTFSSRFPRPQKLWKKGLRCAVDKFMGYRLEEFGKGMFVDRVCYRYREGAKGCISGTEKTKETWANIVNEAVSRRKRYKLKPHKIVVLKDY